MLGKNTNEFIDEYLSLNDEDGLLLLDGLGEAILGIDPASNKVVYSKKKILEILSQKMEAEEAEEYYEFNIECAYFGEKTPILVLDTM